MNNRLEKAFQEFDKYNSRDPHTEVLDGKPTPKELLYGKRMTERLEKYYPNAAEHVKLAARCQHIGRWEIPRSTYPMDKKGYLLWRSMEKQHHVKVAEPILKSCGYDEGIIDKVKSLLLKKELFTNEETQLLEDVVCLVFIEHYLGEFASHHDDEKVIDILRKTIKKISARCLEEASKLDVPDRVQTLLLKAIGGN